MAPFMDYLSDGQPAVNGAMRFAARRPALIFLLVLATCNADTEPDGALDRIARTGFLRAVRRLENCDTCSKPKKKLVEV